MSTQPIPQNSPIIIPDDFKDPTSHELLIFPVRANCDEKDGKWAEKITWTTGYPFFQGHVFEKLTLSSSLRNAKNRECPACNRIISKVTPDLNLAQRISNEFVKLSSANANYSRERSSELIEQHVDLLDKPVVPGIIPELSEIQTAEEEMITDLQHENVKSLGGNSNMDFYDLSRRNFIDFKFLASLRCWRKSGRSTVSFFVLFTKFLFNYTTYNLSNFFRKKTINKNLILKH